MLPGPTSEGSGLTIRSHGLAERLMSPGPPSWIQSMKRVRAHSWNEIHLHSSPGSSFISSIAIGKLLCLAKSQFPSSVPGDKYGSHVIRLLWGIHEGKHARLLAECLPCIDSAPPLLIVLATCVCLPTSQLPACTTLGFFWSTEPILPECRTAQK